MYPVHGCHTHTHTHITKVTHFKNVVKEISTSFTSWKIIHGSKDSDSMQSIGGVTSADLNTEERPEGRLHAKGGLEGKCQLIGWLSVELHITVVKERLLQM